MRVTLAALATLRSVSVVLGLVSLKHVPASFTETVKSTAPLFTVYMQHAVLGTRTSPQVLASLLPVMAGLVLCARAEVAFDAIGFWAAVGNNVIDCFQNVVSKKVLAKITPVRLQFYTSVLALLFQIPLLLYNDVLFSGDRSFFDRRGAVRSAILNSMTLGGGGGSSSSRRIIDSTSAETTSDPLESSADAMAVSTTAYYLYFLANVCCYHAQSISAYFVVAKVSPVTMSVANTLKRTLLIVICVGYFGNAVTTTSALGVATVIGGVFVYNRARVRYPAPPNRVVAQQGTSCWTCTSKGTKNIDKGFEQRIKKSSSALGGAGDDDDPLLSNNNNNNNGKNNKRMLSRPKSIKDYNAQPSDSDSDDDPAEHDALVLNMPVASIDAITVEHRKLGPRDSASAYDPYLNGHSPRSRNAAV